MVNSLVPDADEVASERTCHHSPSAREQRTTRIFWLGEEVGAAAFKVHPYHHDTIGLETDLETMTRDDLLYPLTKDLLRNRTTR